MRRHLLNAAALAVSLAWAGAQAYGQSHEQRADLAPAAVPGASDSAGAGEGANAKAKAGDGEAPAPAFDQAFLDDPANIETGRQVWEKQCRHCHGASAYPGKAPKLVPGRMQPDFIYDRVTYGFRKMPAWKDVFDDHERMSVSAYIKSKAFSP